MPNPVVHFEIIGKDRQLLESFCRGLFDWQCQEAMPGYSLVQAGGGSGGGIGVNADTPSHVTFHMQSSDLKAKLAAAESKGGTRCFGPHTLPDGVIIGGFFDPGQPMIGLIQPASGT